MTYAQEWPTERLIAAVECVAQESTATDAAILDGLALRIEIIAADPDKAAAGGWRFGVSQLAAELAKRYGDPAY